MDSGRKEVVESITINGLLESSPTNDKCRHFNSYDEILSAETYHPSLKKKRYMMGPKKLAEVIARQILDIFFDLLCDDLIDLNYRFVFPNKKYSLSCGLKQNTHKPNYKYNLKRSGRDYILRFNYHVIKQTTRWHLRGRYFYAKFIGRNAIKFQEKIESGHIYS